LNYKNKIPKYIKDLVRNNPKITSGRKNFANHQFRIVETIKLIKKYFKNKLK
tara:strand:- start:375 stop:530 length:156 start_codon:yes stop_codon:yes gene_type:complete